MTDTSEALSIVVIGAGQAGLSVGYHLQRQGLRPGTDFLIVDAGPHAGGAWQHRWESLRFGDAHALADLPGMADAAVTFAGAPSTVPASEVVSSRYGAYEQHFGLRVRRPANVRSVERAAGGALRVNFDDGTAVMARVVIGATGTWRSPRQPTTPGTEVFRGRQLTTPEFTSPAEFADLRVGVVGGGASALGFVRELAPHAAHLTWFTRAPVRFLPVDSQPAKEFGRESVRLQDEAARAGRPLPSIVSTTGMPMTAHLRRMRDAGLLERTPMFTRLVTDGAVMADGTFTALDAVLWALGFEADLGPFEPLGMRARDGVAVEAGHVLAVPGVFLAGYGPQASTISANRGARVIARDALRFLDDGQWPPVPPTPVRASGSGGADD
ncbi:flavin-containing monooxygenase [Demequina globuliformis]|uniref:flavin-containing monooxygenase n=1 Tax=Demequina globuliformis TaxID=676202 RepID=UPI000A02ED21|nr:NAD(P)/FAD-dependent oxidoreductase [Demequina globuliformis]